MRFADLKIENKSMENFTNLNIEWAMRQHDLLKVVDYNSTKPALWFFSFEERDAPIFHEINGAHVMKDTCNMSNIKRNTRIYFDKDNPMSAVWFITYGGRITYVGVSDDLLHNFFPDYKPQQSLEEQLAQVLQKSGVLEEASKSGQVLTNVFFVSTQDGQKFKIGVAAQPVTDIEPGTEVIALPAPGADQA